MIYELLDCSIVESEEKCIFDEQRRNICRATKKHPHPQVTSERTKINTKRG